jgi:hypothetical protein
MVTILLNILCVQGLGIISWIIVFIPFILMTVMVSILLYIFGLDASTGKLKYTCENNNNTEKNENIVSNNRNGDILIYDPEYNPKKNPVYYQSPNIIIPNPKNNDPILH